MLPWQIRRITHLSVGTPDVGFCNGGPDRLSRLAGRGRGFSGCVDFGLGTCVSRGVAGNTSGDRSLRLGED